MAMDWGAAVGAAAQIGGELIGNKQQNAGNFKQRKWAREQNEKAYAYQTEMWDKTNAYNSPVEQMKRLKAAGINPNLIYGSGSESGGITSPMSAPNQQSYVNPNQGINIGESVARVYDTTSKALSNDLTKIQIAAEAQRIAESQVRSAKMGGVDTQKGYQEINESTSRIEAQQAGTVRTKVGTEADLQQLTQAYRLQDISAQSATEALRSQQLGNERDFINNSTLSDKNKLAMKEAVARIKEAGSRNGSRGVQQQLDKEKLDMRKKGVETSDPIWARVSHQVLKNSEEDDEGAWEKVKGWFYGKHYRQEMNKKNK